MIECVSRKKSLQLFQIISSIFGNTMVQKFRDLKNCKITSFLFDDNTSTQRYNGCEVDLKKNVSRLQLP